MRVLLCMYGARRNVEPMVGLAVQLRVKECNAPGATGVMHAGGWL